MNKPFSKDLYNKDDPAKELVIDFFRSRYGWVVYVNPDQYGIDLIVENERGTFELEVEVKHGWKGKDFPWQSLHFAARKVKFAKNPDHVTFITLNDDWTWALVTEGIYLKEARIITKNTMYTYNEQFMEVPISKCQLLQLS